MGVGERERERKRQMPSNVQANGTQSARLSRAHLFTLLKIFPKLAKKQQHVGPHGQFWPPPAETSCT